MEINGQLHISAATLETGPRYAVVRGYVEPSAGLGAVKKKKIRVSLPRQEYNLDTLVV
jgi:hypothetical protein